MTKNYTTNYFNAKQATLPLFISDFLDICDPVLTFDQFMEGINLTKYLNCLLRRWIIKLMKLKLHK